jgi:hypothetical protein
MPAGMTSSGGAFGTAAGSCASARIETNAFLPRPTRLNAGRLTPAAAALAAYTHIKQEVQAQGSKW